VLEFLYISNIFMLQLTENYPGRANHPLKSCRNTFTSINWRLREIGLRSFFRKRNIWVEFCSWTN